MDISLYTDRLREELLTAADAGGDDARALAERLLAPLDSSIRLVLLEALSDAADEITREIAPGSVEVRLRGRAPDFVVTPPPTTAAPAPRETVPEPMPEDDDGGGPTTRINLRLPDALKARIEAVAAGEHLSVNAWLVRAAAAALSRPPTSHERPDAASRGGQRLTGWVR